MNGILYHVQKPGQIYTYGRLTILLAENNTSLTDNLTNKYVVDTSKNFTDLQNVVSGDLLYIPEKSTIELIKNIEDTVITSVNIVNLFKSTRMSTGIVSPGNIVSYMASLVQEGISNTQMDNAFSIGITQDASNYKQSASINVDTSANASDRVMAQIPEIFVKGLSASLYSKVIILRVDKNTTTKTHVGLVIDVRTISKLRITYDGQKPTSNRGISNLQINDKMIDFNMANVVSNDGKISQNYYLNLDGTIVATLPDWITTIQGTGTMYDSADNTSSPAQIAKGVLPTSQGSNFKLELSKDSIINTGIGDIWEMTVTPKNNISRKIAGTLTQITETQEKYELTFGFNNPRLKISY